MPKWMLIMIVSIYINSKQQYSNSKRDLNIVLGIQKDMNYKCRNRC